MNTQTRNSIVLSLLCSLVLLPGPAAAQGDPGMPAATGDIVDTAVAAGSFKTLAKALAAADLVDTLKSKGPFTVFAPTDEAFAKLPKDTLAADAEALTPRGARALRRRGPPAQGTSRTRGPRARPLRAWPACAVPAV
jgi:hypothetical protein